jgi:hypothetical protein
MAPLRCTFSVREPPYDGGFMLAVCFRLRGTSVQNCTPHAKESASCLVPERGASPLTAVRIPADAANLRAIKILMTSTRLLTPWFSVKAVGHRFCAQAGACQAHHTPRRAATAIRRNDYQPAPLY